MSKSLLRQSLGGAQFSDRRHQGALKADKVRIVEMSALWYRETLECFRSKALTWDDLSDQERALFRAVEKWEERKAGKR